ncbi:MAG: HAD family hydrolase [Deltaproteobacteria bacterium]|nr:MAG: HAD family hydrolase [Deltaproteobacteria bacterium]
MTRALESLGVSVRYMPGKTGWKGHARITVPADDGDFDMLEGALAKVLKPRALLFDLDGVLADVSGSYLKAIVECAASFGVEVNPAEVAREKSKPGTNNDWELTRRLLARRGVTVGLAAVRERFEMFYQGNRERSGLWRNERLLWPKSRLKALRTRLPLGIVTGRPKADAWRFLDRFGLSELFGAVVCLEDAPAKPSPEPVMLALRQLDVERAWMVGDSPDDMDAARSAGVVPVGFARKGPGARLRAQALRRRGAAAVLSSPAELSALLDAVGIRS